MQRVAPLALTASVVAADTAGLHSLSFYLLLGAIAALAVAALRAYGDLVDLPGSAPTLGAARTRATLAVLALALAVVAAIVRAPTLVENSVPPVAVSALVAALALLAVKSLVGLVRR